MCSTPQIKLPTKSSLQHTLKLQTRAQNLNSYCVIVVVAIYSGSHGQRGSGCDGCCNRRGGCGSRGRMKEFSWNACWCVENEWKVYPIFLHTDKMEKIASRLIFGLSSSLCDRISVGARLLNFFFFSGPALDSLQSYRRLSEPQTWISTFQPSCVVACTNVDIEVR